MTKLTIELDDQAHGAGAQHVPLIRVSVDGEPVGVIQKLSLEARDDLPLPKVSISITDYSALCSEEAHAHAVKRSIGLLQKVPFLQLTVATLKNRKDIEKPT